MKPKHSSLVAVFLAVLAVGGMLWFEFMQTDHPLAGPDLKAFAPISDIPVPSAADLARMDRLERSLSMLAVPPPQFRSPTDLAALGYLDVRPSTHVGATGGAIPEPSQSHRLTLAFDGKAKRFCVIDSRLFTEGALLPDGATILKIESRRVLITKKSIRQWLMVDPLFYKDSQPKDS